MKFRLNKNIFGFGKGKDKTKEEQTKIEFVPTDTIYLKSGPYHRLQGGKLVEQEDRYVYVFEDTPALKVHIFKSDISIVVEGHMHPKVALKDKQ